MVMLRPFSLFGIGIASSGSKKINDLSIWVRPGIRLFMDTIPRRPWIGAIDQGTTSSRFFVFDADGQVVASHRKEVKLYSPHSG